MRKIFLIAAALAAPALAAPAQAQFGVTPFAFEVRGGGALPRADLGDRAGNGYSLGGNITFHFAPMVGVYVGYSTATFDAEGAAGRYRDSGVDAGIRFTPPTPLFPIDPWIRAGLVYHGLKGEDFADPDDDVETEMGLGFQVGAGLGFGFGPVSLTPGITLTRYDAEDADGDVGTVEYFGIELGGRIRL
jgi:outer membrane protein with beta-barrel domain